MYLFILQRYIEEISLIELQMFTIDVHWSKWTFGAKNRKVVEKYFISAS